MIDGKVKVNSGFGFSDGLFDKKDNWPRAVCGVPVFVRKLRIYGIVCGNPITTTNRGWTPSK